MRQITEIKDQSGKYLVSVDTAKKSVVLPNRINKKAICRCRCRSHIAREASATEGLGSRSVQTAPYGDAGLRRGLLTKCGTAQRTFENSPSRVVRTGPVIPHDGVQTPLKVTCSDISVDYANSAKHPSSSPRTQCPSAARKCHH